MTCFRLLVTYLKNILKRINSFNPTRISERQAQVFFEQAGRENKEFVNLLQPFLLESKVIFDIGANAGFFSKEILEAGFQGKIILFEPVPNLLSIAVKTLAAYHQEKIFINAALGDCTGEIDLYLPNDSNIGWITAVQEKTQQQKSIKVRLLNTADYAQLFKPDLIKVDVEGYEVFILRPWLEIINEHYKPIFFVELGWGISNPHWPLFMQVAQVLVEREGYVFYDARQRREMTLDDLASVSQTIDVLIKPQLKTR